MYLLNTVYDLSSIGTNARKYMRETNLGLTADLPKQNQERVKMTNRGITA